MCIFKDANNSNIYRAFECEFVQTMHLFDQRSYICQFFGINPK